MRRILTTAIVAGAALSAVAAMAQEGTCAMTYAFFEEAIPHIDMEACPAAIGGADLFCRAHTGTDAVHVYVFSLEGESCLVETRSFYDEAFAITLAE